VGPFATCKPFARGLAQELGLEDFIADLGQPRSTETHMSPENVESGDFQRGLTRRWRFLSHQTSPSRSPFWRAKPRHVTGTIINVDSGFLT